MDSEHDYYSILDVPREASDAEIRRAFRALAKEHHPDSRVAGGSDERDFRLITEAYETLKDSNRRAAYDQELDEARQFETQASYTGKRSFAVGLGVGILLAIVAVGVVNYLGGAGRTDREKAQDSLKDVLGFEKTDSGRRVPPQRNIAREAAADAPLPTETGKPPSPAPAQAPWVAPSPIDA